MALLEEKRLKHIGVAVYSQGYNYLTGFSVVASLKSRITKLSNIGRHIPVKWWKLLTEQTVHLLLD